MEKNGFTSFPTPKETDATPMHVLSTLFQHFKLPKKSFQYFPKGLVDLKCLKDIAGGVVFDLNKPVHEANFINLLKKLGITVVVYLKQFDPTVENTTNGWFISIPIHVLDEKDQEYFVKYYYEKKTFGKMKGK